MGARKRQRLGAQAWRALLARQAESGQTVAAFCAREGLRPVSFYRWRSKLGQLDPQTKGARAADEPVGTAGFIDLGTLGAGASRLELRLDLGGGVRLQLTRG